MTYRSILSVFDGGPESRAAVEVAASLADRWGGHLDVLCLGVDRTPTTFYAADLGMEMVSHLHSQAMREGKAHSDEIEPVVAGSGAPYSLRVSGARLAELHDVVGEAAWPQDLVVLPRPFGTADDEVSEAVLDAALFGGPAPILILPRGGGAPDPKKIAIGWNGTPEAMRAIRAALPLIADADAVEVIVVDPSVRGAEEAGPGASVATYLARHGAKVEVTIAARVSGSIGETLLGRASEWGADLLVMGGYGHSRLRERVLGGVTRDILHEAKLPVLMAR